MDFEQGSSTRPGICPGPCKPTCQLPTADANIELWMRSAADEPRSKQPTPASVDMSANKRRKLEVSQATSSP